MNRTYALVWNPSLATWTVTHEHARRRGKGAGAVLAAALLLGGTASAADLPTGGQVVSGSGQIGTPSANQMVIDQASNKLAIDWQSFDIAAGHKVTFNQPGSSSIALNRVLGADGSKIMGQLDANGRVFIINPNGVLFGQGAQVNVGGLVASTLDISNNDFEAGNYRFKGDSSNHAVINNGKITAADGGAVALLGGTVSNNGVIVARQGTVALAAGNKVTLDFAGDGLLNVQVDEAVVDALVENHQLIKADGGQVLLTANAGNALLKTVVNNTGVIEAQTLGEKDGKIVLLGSFDGGTVQVAGTLDASAPTGGNGGFIETSGAHVKVANSAKVTTKAASGKTGKWLIDPNDFTVAASGGDMTGATVAANLANTNFEIQTATMGTAGGKGDIHVNDAITWSSDNTLTLTAERNININAAITATGSNAGLALNYGGTNSNSATPPAAGSDYNVKAPITLSGANSSLNINGNAYTLIRSMTDMQAINGNLGGRYALAQNLDASGTTYGQALVGSASSPFTGTFAGLGHTISNLTIAASGSDYVGLFGKTVSSVIRDIGMLGGSVTGRNLVGGLVGYSIFGTISNAYATGNVAGNEYVGGLTGYSQATIRNAYATGNVTGVGNIVGGLIGLSYLGAISNAYATGSVTGKESLGGLIGQNYTTISNAYATGSVTGSNNIGGLVGYHLDNTIINSYATGNVTGNNNVGGLVGQGHLAISNSYAISSVTGNNNIGGLIGFNNSIDTTNSFYATTDASGNSINNGGASTGAFSGNSTGNGTAKTRAELGQAATFTGWDIASTGGSSAVWRIYEGHAGPLLRSFLKSVTLTADAISKTYDSNATGTTTYTSSLGSELDTTKIQGSLSYTSSSKNAGTYSSANGTLALSGQYSSQQGYDISYADASLVIGKANISAVTGITAENRTYDGTNTATLSYANAGFTGLIGTDALSVISASGTYADKNAANGKAVSINSIALGGADAGNYTLVNSNATSLADIAKAALTITAANASKTAGQGLVLSGYTSNGLVSSDSITSLSLSSAGTPASAATGNYVIVASAAVGAAMSNYQISYMPGELLVKTEAVEEGPLSSQPYMGVMVSNSQTVSIESKQQANETEALTQTMLATNPLDERLNLQVINTGIRLPEGF